MRYVKKICEYNTNCRERPWTSKAVSEAGLRNGCVSLSKFSLPCSGSICMHLTVRWEIFVGHLSQQENSPVEVNPQPPIFISYLRIRKRRQNKVLLSQGQALRPGSAWVSQWWLLTPKLLGIQEKSTLHHQGRGAESSYHLSLASRRCNPPNAASSQLRPQPAAVPEKNHPRSPAPPGTGRDRGPKPGPACHACLKPPAINGGRMAAGGNEGQACPINC